MAFLLVECTESGRALFCGIYNISSIHPSIHPSLPLLHYIVATHGTASFNLQTMLFAQMLLQYNDTGTLVFFPAIHATGGAIGLVRFTESTGNAMFGFHMVQNVHFRGQVAITIFAMGHNGVDLVLVYIIEVGMGGERWVLLRSS